MFNIETLKAKAKNEEIIAKMNEIIEAINSLQEAPKRDRGPKSTREMTDEDANRVLRGDLKDVSHKDAAEELGLSYGQIYSCRGGYTFRHLQ